MSLREEMIERMTATYIRMMESDAEGADWNLEEIAMGLLDALLDGLEADQSWVPNCDYECNCGRGLGLVAALRGESA